MKAIVNKIEKIYGKAGVWCVKKYYHRDIELCKCDKGSVDNAVERIINNTLNDYHYRNVDRSIYAIKSAFDDDYKKYKKEKRADEKRRKEATEIVSSIEGYLAIDAGKNSYNPDAKYSTKNEIFVYEEKDYNGYAHSCHFTMIRRQVNIFIKKGYSLHNVGGLMTFVRGKKIERTGMACEWAVQGKALAEITMHKGYLVRGEHIECKTLAEAKKISKEHRQKAMIAILKRRKIDRNTLVTVDDSLAAGNCLPGTLNFKSKIERELGCEITSSLPARQVLLFGRKFGVETYAQRAVNQAARARSAK